jgi:disulfide bond formation protein DsbB
MSIRLATKLNALALYAIAGILLAAFYFQIALDELPCPLCLLQRVGFAALAIGPVLTLRYGPRPAHYGLVIVGALIGAGIAARQVLLHIAPGDPGYGSPVLGLHYYTWAAIIFAVAILATAVMLLFDRPLKMDDAPRRLGAAATVAIWLALAVTVAEAGSALIECGFGECPDNPVAYELLPDGL